MVYAPEDRLRRLYAALETRTRSVRDLELIPSESDACVLRLSSPRGPFAILRISDDEVTVTTRSNGLHAHAGSSEIVDELGIDLSAGFAWDDVHCESADELAHLLVKHMHRRIRDCDPEPQVA